MPSAHPAQHPARASRPPPLTFFDDAAEHRQRKIRHPFLRPATGARTISGTGWQGGENLRAVYRATTARQLFLPCYYFNCMMAFKFRVWKTPSAVDFIFLPFVIFSIIVLHRTDWHVVVSSSPSLVFPILVLIADLGVPLWIWRSYKGIAYFKQARRPLSYYTISLLAFTNIGTYTISFLILKFIHEFGVAVNSLGLPNVALSFVIAAIVPLVVTGAEQK